MTAFPHPRSEAGAAAAPARVVLVTGAARRIGRALALGFAAQGWDVGVHYGASKDEADSLVAEIRALGRRAVALAADLAIERETAGLVGACTAALGRPVCVVNNASRFVEDTARDVGYETLLAHMAVNVRAAALLIDQMARRHRDGEALVVNLLDSKLSAPNPDYLSYTLSKAALASLTELAARALASPQEARRRAGSRA